MLIGCSTYISTDRQVGQSHALYTQLIDHVYSVPGGPITAQSITVIFEVAKTGLQNCCVIGGSIKKRAVLPFGS
jgi:hypothetical protein